MKYADLNDEQFSKAELLVNQTRIEFENTFGFGLGKSYPFSFVLDEQSEEMKVALQLSSKLHLKKWDLIRYQRRYKRRSPKYLALCDSLQLKQNKLNEIPLILRKYKNWFNLHNINDGDILEQVNESKKFIQIASDINKLKEFDLEVELDI